MKPGFLIVDGNHVGYWHQNTRKLTAGGRETQAIFGFILTLRKLRLTYPQYAMTVLWDGHPQFRYDQYPGYKAKRDATPQMAEMREKYREARPLIQRGLRLLGVRQMECATHEADDLAYSVRNVSSQAQRHSILITGDQDWLQLVDEHTDWMNLDERKVTINNFHKETGYATPKAFVEGKCLVGDAGDTIGGVGRIGKESAPILLAQYGSVANLIKAVRDGTFDPEPLKIVRGLAGSAERFAKNEKDGLNIFKRNRLLMDLSKAPPPTKIITDPGTPSVDEFEQFCDELAFETILLNLPEFLSAFPAFKNLENVIRTTT